MKYTFEIELNGEKTTLLFGNWACGQLVREGFNITKFTPEIFENPYLLAPFVFYLGACNQKGYEEKNLSSSARDYFNESDFQIFCEDAPKEVIVEGVKKFYRSVFGDVFMDEVERVTKEDNALSDVSSDDKKKVTTRKKN